MTKAVLRSLWCTWGFAESILIVLHWLTIEVCLHILHNGGTLSGDRKQDLTVLEELQSSQQDY